MQAQQPTNTTEQPTNERSRSFLFRARCGTMVDKSVYFSLALLLFLHKYREEE
jgi:hypothetical protein